jgi:hypothetical protein
MDIKIAEKDAQRSPTRHRIACYNARDDHCSNEYCDGPGEGLGYLPFCVIGSYAIQLKIIEAP